MRRGAIPFVLGGPSDQSAGVMGGLISAVGGSMGVVCVASQLDFRLQTVSPLTHSLTHLLTYLLTQHLITCNISQSLLLSSCSKYIIPYTLLPTVIWLNGRDTWHDMYVQPSNESKSASWKPFKQLLEDSRFCPLRSGSPGSSCDGRLVFFGAQVTLP